MSVKEKNQKKRLMLDQYFGEICAYAEIVSLEDVEDHLKDPDSFLTDLNQKEIKKYWGLVRYGVLNAASVFMDLIIDEDGNIDSKKINEINQIIQNLEAEEDDG